MHTRARYDITHQTAAHLAAHGRQEQQLAERKDGDYAAAAAALHDERSAHRLGEGGLCQR
jgi:hypothetical protein